jgi:hypothetical protein
MIWKGYPNEPAAHLVVKTVREYLEENHANVNHFCLLKHFYVLKIHLINLSLIGSYFAFSWKKILNYIMNIYRFIFLLILV